MSIIYCVVAKENTVLVEHTSAAGNFPIITQSILSKITPDTKLSYSYNSKYWLKLAIFSTIYLLSR